MGALATIAPRLRKFVLLLASNQPGEVVAAAAALCRTLKSAGLDLHDLADALENGQAQPHRHQLHEVDRWWQEIAEACLGSGFDFSPTERKFLRDMCRWARRPSERQEAWLRALVEKVRAVIPLSPSHRDPERFHLEKDAIVHELRRLALQPRP
jgi:hypothetical protein